MTALHFRAGPLLEPDAFAWVRQKLCLESCKWYPQIGDVATLARFPVILEKPACEFLGATAEQLTKEIFDAEREILNRREPLAKLALPDRLVSVLSRDSQVWHEAPRVMRFDFHWTASGWRISEVNCDVPGGFAEASDFPKLLSAIFTDLEPIGDPTKAWTRSILTRKVGEGVIALLAAPTFTAHQQVVAYLGRLSRQAALPAISALLHN